MKASGRRRPFLVDGPVELKCQDQGQGDASEGFRLSMAQRSDRCRYPHFIFMSGLDGRLLAW